MTGIETIAAVAAAAATVAGTAYTISKGSPSLPPIPKAPAPPPQAPPPAALPPAPTEATTGDTAESVRQKARRALGQERTILTTPLGVGGAPNKTLLGG